MITTILTLRNLQQKQNSESHEKLKIKQEPDIINNIINNNAVNFESILAQIRMLLFFPASVCLGN